MTNSDEPVLGVLTGQVPVSGPMGSRDGTFVDRLRKQAQEMRDAEQAAADEDEGSV